MVDVRLGIKWFWIRVQLQSVMFRFCTCFEQGVSWHSDNYRPWIQSETLTWLEKDIQSNAPYRLVLRTQFNHLASLAKYLSCHLRTKFFWVRVTLQSLNLQSSCLLQAKSSLTFSQLQSVYSFWNAYWTRQEHTVKCTVQICTQNTAQSFGQFGQMIGGSFRN